MQRSESRFLIIREVGYKYGKRATCDMVWQLEIPVWTHDIQYIQINKYSYERLI